LVPIAGALHTSALSYNDFPFWEQSSASIESAGSRHEKGVGFIFYEWSHQNELKYCGAESRLGRTQMVRSTCGLREL